MLVTRGLGHSPYGTILVDFGLGLGSGSPAPVFIDVIKFRIYRDGVHSTNVNKISITNSVQLQTLNQSVARPNILSSLVNKDINKVTIDLIPEQKTFGSADENKDNIIQPTQPKENVYLPSNKFIVYKD